MKERWKALMQRLHFKPNEEVFEFLKQKYTEQHRAYHNLHHIKACLEHLDTYPKKINHKNELELAIWFHDIIYDPFRKNNELKSAEELEKFLKRNKADPNLMQMTYDLILSTLHRNPPKNESEALIMNIDISILGSSASDYKTYRVQIRKEYKWVPYFLYRSKRKEILKAFLRRERLYFTDYFYDKYEQLARANILKEIEDIS